MNTQENEKEDYMKGYTKETISKLFKNQPLKTILKNPEALDPDSNFVPDEILFREIQVAKITRILNNIFLGVNTGNAILRGSTGTGKTFSTKFLLSAFEKVAMERGFNVKIGYASGHIIGLNSNLKERAMVSPQRYIAELMNSMGYHITPSSRGGYGWGRLMDMLRDYLNEQDYEYYIFVLDDIHRLKEIPFFMHFARPKQVWGLKRGLTVFYITSSESFIKKIPREGKYSFTDSNIFFSSYSAPQLYKIMEQRLTYALEKPAVIPEEALWLIAKYGYEGGGDARYSLRVLSEYVKNYIVGEYDKLSIKDSVMNAIYAVDLEDINNTVRSLSLVSKIILLSLIVEETRNRFRIKQYLLNDIYTIYKSFCEKVGIKPVLSRAFHEHLSALTNTFLLDVGTKRVRGAPKAFNLSTIITMGFLPTVLDVIMEEYILEDSVNVEKIKKIYGDETGMGFVP